jgi:hypothetical protein
VTQLKSQTTLPILFHPLKGKSNKNISMAMTPLKPILATFEAIISANTMPYAKRF